MAARLGITRRGLLIGGGAGVGLVVAWAVWPRHYLPNLVAAPGETVMSAFLKVGEDGHVTVVVPQAEMGQGVWTALPQILADELGADWRTIAVEPAPIGPLYANTFLAGEAATGDAPHALAGISRRVADEMATRSSLMITAGSSSIRGFEQRFREAGAAARMQLCRVAAKRWGIDPGACDTQAGFVVRAPDKLRFAELAADAGALSPPSRVVLRQPGEGALSGKPMPRLDLPAKVDGSVRYAADVRLPDMVFAATRHGPWGKTTLSGTSPELAQKVPGLVAIIDNDRFAAAVATSWWAANRALGLIRPTFQTDGPLADDRSIAAALEAAIQSGNGTRVFAAGDVGGAFSGGRLIEARYQVGFAPHAAIEPLCATARITGDRCELWAPTQAPGLMRDAVAKALAIAPEQVTLYPMQVGGGFGRKIELDAAVEAAIIARMVARPVQLTWSREEETRHGMNRAPAIARLTATLAPDNRIAAMQAQIATPRISAQLADRIMPGDAISRLVASGASDIEGALPAYTIPNFAADHHPADIAVPTGLWPSGANSYTAFFTESFIDELARSTTTEPVSFRMAMLGQAPRLARCLQTAASLGGWDGGPPGSGQGIAAHASFGSYVAVMAQLHVEGGAIKVDRLVAAVDCGRMINPEIVRQQIEGGLIFGMSAALDGRIGYARGLSNATSFADLALPRLADCPDIIVQLLPSIEAPGGVAEIAIPPVAPALANALFSATGHRSRTLPLALA